MPSRLIVSRELADLFRLLAHADRLRLIERRDGRNHFYRLSHPHLADWVLDALPFIDIRQRLEDADHIDTARALWGVPDRNPH